MSFIVENIILDYYYSTTFNKIYNKVLYDYGLIFKYDVILCLKYFICFQNGQLISPGPFLLSYKGCVLPRDVFIRKTIDGRLLESVIYIKPKNK